MTKKANRKPSKADTELEAGAVRIIRRTPVKSANPTRDLIAASPLFDAEWYAAEFEDVADAEVDPAYHYLVEGGLEGRPASPAFHSASYLAYNIDVARVGANPLVHYLQSEEAEKRPFDSIEAFVNAFGEYYSDMSPYLAVAVARSELFDAEWFSKSYPDVKKSGLSPVVYYIVHGLGKRLNPGPEFDGGAYLDSNPDVFAANMNPLVHYVLHGQFEDRKKKAVPPPVVVEKPAKVSTKRKMVEWRTSRIDEAAAVAAIMATPLFDAAWYSMQYGDVSRAGISPALHFYRHGTVENRRPSLYFDPVFYRTQVPELADNSGSALIHYLYNGRAMGLKPIALLSFTPPGRRIIEDLADPIISAPKQIDHQQTDWSRYDHLALASSEKGLFWGHALLGKLDTDGVSELDYAPLNAFARLLNHDEASVLAVGKGTSKRLNPMASQPFRAAEFRGLGPLLGRGVHALADIWFVTENTLRMRLGSLGPDNTSFDETGPVIIRAFQADLNAPGGLILAGEGIISNTGPSIVDILLDNPLAPVILVVSAVDETLREFGILPFPSLCRGGHHHAELVASFQRANPVADYRALSDGLVREFCGWNEPAASAFSISEILVRLEGAIGAEKIFSASVREWLLAIFGVPVRTSTATTEGERYAARAIAAGEGIRTGISSRTSVRTDGATLALCGDGLPTLSALVSRRLAHSANGTGFAGSYLIAERVASRPLWQVVVPANKSDLLGIQPAEAPVEAPVLSWSSDDDAKHSSTEVSALPLAIVYRQPIKPNEATLMAPRAPDAAGPILRESVAPSVRKDWSITAVITAGDAAGTSSALAALATQTIASHVDVVLITRDGTSAAIDDLERLFPARHQILAETGDTRRDLAAAAARSKAQYLLLLDSIVVMHDVRTLETLSTMMSTAQVASAGCAILRETVARKGSLIQFQSGGYFPSHVSLLTAPQLVVSEPNILEVLPVSTYAVFGNSFNCTLVRPDLLAAACASEEGTYSGGRFELQFALAALVDGYRHVCTTGVRVTSIAPRIEHEDIDPLGARFLRPGRWEELLSSVTLVRELR